MKIRPAAPGDAAALAALHHEIFARSVWDAAFWRDAARGGPTRVLLAEPTAGGGPIGLCATRLVLDEAEILTFGVSAPHRGLGAGRRLLDEALRDLEQHGATTIFLDVAEDNIPALTLYEMAGFEVTGRREGYYDSGKTALIMERRSLATGGQ